MKEKNKKFFILIIAFFLLSTMVLSVLNISFFTGFNNQQQESVPYKGYDFYPTNFGWTSEINGNQINLIYHPSELEDIVIGNFDLTGFKLSEKVYLSLDPGNQNHLLAARDLIDNIQFPKIIRSCSEEIPGCENLPLKTCKDATNNIGVIQISFGETEIFQLEKNCLFIQANDLRIGMIADKIIYKYLGVA